MAEMNSKVVETGGQRRCFSKASFRTTLIEALAEIGWLLIEELLLLNVLDGEKLFCF